MTDGNVADAFLSTNDLPLNEIGRAQSARVRVAFAEMVFDRCLLSPARRCMETREIVAPSLPFETRTELREIDFGDWEGRTKAWLEANDPEGIEARRRDPVSFRPPRGESFLDVADRLRALASVIRSDSRATLIVGHRGTLGVLERLLRDFPIDSRDVTPLEPGEYRVI
jgi:probable phosphoglycerate mutase